MWTVATCNREQKGGAKKRKRGKDRATWGCAFRKRVLWVFDFHYKFERYDKGNSGQKEGEREALEGVG